MKKPIYYLTKISDLDDPIIYELFKELCSIPGWDFEQHQKLRCFDFLSLYFRQTLAGKITLKNVLKEQILHKRVDSLATTAVYTFCREIAAEHKIVFEGEESKTVLSFLQKIFGKGAKKKFLRSR